MGRTRFDGTPAQSSGLGKFADDPQLYRREWARKRRADKYFRERENAAEGARKKERYLQAKLKALSKKLHIPLDEVVKLPLEVLARHILRNR